MKIDAAKLRTYLDTMHGHANARDLQSESIRKVVTEAKKDGFDTKALRKVFVRERMEPEKRQTEDDILAAYESALGGKGRALQAIEQGATLDEAAEIGGVHRATVARANAVAKQASNATPHDSPTERYIASFATPPHDPETGEINGEEDTERHVERTGQEDPVCGQPDSEDAGGDAGTVRGLGDGEDDNREDDCGAGGEGQAELAPPPTTNADGMEIPPFLRRERASA